MPNIILPSPAIMSWFFTNLVSAFLLPPLNLLLVAVPICPHRRVQPDS